MLKILLNIGFTQTDGKIYVYLATEGPRKASEIAETLKLTKQRVYEIMTNLKKTGVVESTNNHPTRFTAIPFAMVLNKFLKAKTFETQHFEQNRDEILAAWQLMIKREKQIITN